VRIKRIQVEEGFLSGLDLSFADGLNVIIGPRGSGKTSIIELIRFCLGIQAYTDEFDIRARTHALGVLGSGEVTITIDHDGNEETLTRTGDQMEREPRQLTNPPIILSQNEIETIGIQDTGRLRLIDDFVIDSDQNMANENTLLKEIRSLASQMAIQLQETNEIEEQISSLKNVPIELKDAEKARQEFLGKSKQIVDHKSDLDELGNQSAMLSVKASLLDRQMASLSSWRDEVANVISAAPAIEKWPSSAGKTDELSSFRKTMDKIHTTMNDVLSTINEVIADTAKLNDKASNEKTQVDKRARELRMEIDRAKKGAGELAKRVADLKGRKGQLDALTALAEDKRARLEATKVQRDAKLSQLDAVRGKRFKKRADAASALNSELGPLIEIGVFRSASYSDYENAISDSLHGSNIRYSSLSPKLARSMSPRELSEAIESGDAETIARLCGIARERADRLVSYLMTEGLQRILTCRVDDDVRMKLLVGKDYVGTERLSTGQRCTVVLPVLLSEHGRVLIMDQPEDHLDNAFVVDTVVKAMRSSSQGGQIICCTHNPNIPVLGDASQVAVLASDGTRGFVKQWGALCDSVIVDAISDIMEGGREAFRRRAEFYGESPVTDG